jgi:hypothetical protein
MVFKILLFVSSWVLSEQSTGHYLHLMHLRVIKDRYPNEMSCWSPFICSKLSIAVGKLSRRKFYSPLSLALVYLIS